MPRKAPDGKGVIEHRITFGNYERERLNDLQQSISFSQYASPLKSNVLSVALVGAGAYAGLAYAFEWWPFEKEDEPSFWKNTDVYRFAEAKNNCQLAAFVVDRYENHIILEHLEEMARLQAWVDEHPTPTGFDLMQSRLYVARLAFQDTTLANINAQYQKNLAFATKADEQCVIDKAKEK